jgi:hypothetical protein
MEREGKSDKLRMEKIGPDIDNSYIGTPFFCASLF